MLYLNIRGVKCKYDSLLTKIDEIGPTVVCLTETHLHPLEKFEIDGFAEPFRYDRDNMGGGSMILVRKEIEHICTIAEKKREVGESLWVVIDNNQVN